MQRLLCAAALAVSALLLNPGDSRAIGIHPNCAHGYPWLQAKVLNHFGFIHNHGPLYNHGPYYGGQGYVYRHYPYIAYHHGYVPAYPVAYQGQGGWSVYQGGYYGQHAVPARAIPAKPATPPKSVPPTTKQAHYITAPHETLYPSYLGTVWPGVQE